MLYLPRSGVGRLGIKDPPRDHRLQHRAARQGLRALAPPGHPVAITVQRHSEVLNAAPCEGPHLAERFEEALAGRVLEPIKGQTRSTISTRTMPASSTPRIAHIANHSRIWCDSKLRHGAAPERKLACPHGVIYAEHPRGHFVSQSPYGFAQPMYRAVDSSRESTQTRTALRTANSQFSLTDGF